MTERIKRDEKSVCSQCGLCKNVCPAYKVLKDEIASPRGKNLSFQALQEGKVQIWGKYFFEYCNGCEACVAVCPLKCGFDVIKAREYLVAQGFTSPENDQMVENIEKYRNPFGKLDEGTSAPDKLYCC